MNSFRFTALLLTSLVMYCHGRSEGTIQLNAGMTKDQAQRRSTIKLNEYGDSGRLFDFTLANEPLQLRGCTQYSIDTKNGVIEGFSVATQNVAWKHVRQGALDIEATLLAHGWKRDPRFQLVATLPTSPRDAAKRITDSGVIDSFGYAKGNVGLRLTVAGLWGGIPFYRDANRAKVFWRSIDLNRLDAEEIESLKKAGLTF